MKLEIRLTVEEATENYVTVGTSVREIFEADRSQWIKDMQIQSLPGDQLQVRLQELTNNLVNRLVNELNNHRKQSKGKH